MLPTMPIGPHSAAHKLLYDTAASSAYGISAVHAIKEPQEKTQTTDEKTPFYPQLINVAAKRTGVHRETCPKRRPFIDVAPPLMHMKGNTPCYTLVFAKMDTVSTWNVWGNMSTGVARTSSKPAASSSLASRAHVAGSQLT